MLDMLSAKIVSLSVLMGCLTAFGWTRLTPMHRPRAVAEDSWRVRGSYRASRPLADQLGLNAGEKARLQSLKNKHMPSFQILIQEVSASVVDRDVMLERVNLFKDRFYADFLNMLGPEQQVRFLEIMVNWRASGDSDRRWLLRTARESKGRIWV